MVKAIGLISGGLDSLLSVKLILDQGIEVTGIAFVSPFCRAANAPRVAEKLGIPLIIRDFTIEQYEIVKHPPHGHGRNINPCIDCHALMLSVAGREMESMGADFVFTGEVLGQRPFSQNRASMDLIARLSGYNGYILRPMSAKLLKQTIPESDGRVNRSRLLTVSGRSRQIQLEMAAKFGIDFFEPTAGGCKLTEPNFAWRVRETLADDPDFPVADIPILTVSRHFRLAPHVRLVVGKNEAENDRIEQMARPADLLLRVDGFPSATAWLPQPCDEKALEIACRIIARYSDAPAGAACNVHVSHPGGEPSVRSAVPFSPDESNAYLITIERQE
ncbi:MAG: tRNA 4-thiouridine(8) synthase ThiI [Candidatus Brocadiia bacterium]